MRLLVLGSGNAAACAKVGDAASCAMVGVRLLVLGALFVSTFSITSSSFCVSRCQQGELGSRRGS